MIARPRTVHFVGIGGMHMSAIAQLLLADGIEVSGSDLVMSPLTDRLQALGARVQSGHDPSNLGNATLVVTTAAAKSDNVELVEARSRGIPIIPRHEMVANLMEGRTAVAIAGTHGKTTTSSLVAFMLQTAGRDPAYLLGGESIDLGGNASPGMGRHIVVEADEYAGAFLAYHPAVAVVTNIESDHLDYFENESNMLAAFRRFVDNVSPEGVVIACADSPLLRQILGEDRPPPAANVRWYAVKRPAEWTASDITLQVGGGSEFSIASADRRWHATLPLPGLHNVANALGAFVAGDQIGLEAESMIAALAAFRGAHRRFELVGEAGDIAVVDDYAHHPTEIAATLSAARSRYPGRRIVVLFQPHTYSRTRYLLEGFRNCFGEADELFLLQTFAARETADEGLDAFDLAEAIKGRLVRVVSGTRDAVELLARELRPGDVCFTMGAGDVTNVGRPLLEGLCSR